MEDYSFERDNSLGEISDEEENEGNHNCSKVIMQTQKEKINSKVIQVASFASVPESLEIKKLEILSLRSFIESIRLKFAPEDYIVKGNNGNLRLTDNVYVFQVTWKNQTWKIRKRLADFQALDYAIKKIALENAIKDSQMYPIPKNEIDKVSSQLHDQFFLYLTKCIHHAPLRESEILQQFLEISAIDHQGHKKFKESFLIKKAGGRTNENRCVRCGVFWGNWNKRYFCITSDGVSISKGMKETNCQIREMLMFDYDFSVDYGIQDTGYEKGIRLNSSNRKLTLEALSLFQYFDFLACLKEAIDQSPYLGTHRFASFSPIREGNLCKWYVDGQDYYRDVYKYIKKAEHEIFITDWWLSPQLHLLRPVQSKNTTTTGGGQTDSKIPSSEGLSRLDLLLEQKARQKVKIFIIVYKEPKIALSMDSHFTKQILMGLHSNIKVLRHPSTLIPFMWSHHEKLVIVDQKVGFLGGLDLCYGRMDNPQHLLFDPADTQGDSDKQFWPGIDFANSRTKDFVNVRNYDESDIDRMIDQRMPWHDIAMRVVGDGVIDLTRHFIQYWNFVLADLELASSKENKFILRARKEENDELSSELSKNSKQKVGFLNKLKKKWKNLRNSRDEKQKEVQQQLKPERDEEQLDTKQNLLEKNPVSIQDILQGGEGFSFQRQNQNDLYFNQLARESRASANFKPVSQSSNGLFSVRDSNPNKSNIGQNTNNQIFGDNFGNQNSKFPSSRSSKQPDQNGNLSGVNGRGSQPKETQNEFKPDGSINGDNKKSIDGETKQRNVEENDENHVIEEQKEESKESSKEDITIDPLNNNNNNVVTNPQTFVRGNSAQVIISKDPTVLVMASAFPVLQKIVSTQENNGFALSEDQGLRKLRSNSLKEKKQELDQQFFDILQEVRIAKEEDASLGYLKKRTIEKKEPSLIDRFRRQKSVDSDSSVESLKDDDQDIILDNKKAIKPAKGKSVCQVVRSSSVWSCGVKETECSIHIAYIQLIGQAEHFIYIENQFFISGLAGLPVKNGISQAIVSRIKQAQINGEKFKVVVILPLLPGFEGEIDGNSSILKVQLHWEYATISRGGTSILETLKKEGIQNPEEYISFYGLRTHSRRPIDGEPVTEIVYVHSKLMIVDDRIVLMGSANINDRSMKGSRDSEIAMIVEDKTPVNITMNGEQYEASQFAHSLRMSLFGEHFGLSSEDLIDPLNDQLHKKMIINAKVNTEIYREIFRCYPDDEIKSTSDWEAFKNKKDLSKYDEFKSQIVGFAVDFPKLFLEDENLKLHMNQKEYYLPDSNFI